MLSSRYDGKSVYAIAFGTSDFPFLINLKKLNQKFGRPEGRRSGVAMARRNRDAIGHASANHEPTVRGSAITGYRGSGRSFSAI